MNNKLITSKITTKSQTVIPMAVRKKLGLKPGDLVRYLFRKDHVEIEKLSTHDDAFDPFIAFTEWASEADEKAFGHLKPHD